MLTLDVRLFGQWQKAPARYGKSDFSADSSLIYLDGHGAMGNIALEACISSIQPDFLTAPVELFSPINGQPFYYRDAAGSLQVTLSGKYRTSKKITYGGTLFWRSPLQDAEFENFGDAAYARDAGDARNAWVGQQPRAARVAFVGQSTHRLENGLLGIASAIGGDLTLAGGLSLGESPPTYLIGAEYKGKLDGLGYSVGLNTELGDDSGPWLGLTGTAGKTAGNFVYELTSCATLLDCKAASNEDASPDIWPNQGSVANNTIVRDPGFPSPWTWRGSSIALRIAPLNHRGLSWLLMYDWDARRLTLGGSISY